ncbi:uncharacterized protein LOC131977736 [Centropristis striata]|uniref:uncharacterized protein LOC131977736 n=1 Tax=Centropristis striata TaxID=184440 RepID=UPI0027DFFD20|nr:uncharacterized protein LOC131977736 [Centropristis striata]
MATNTNSSSKYDHITCKDLIKSGSPTVWQLIPKKENIGTLTKMTLGERNVTKMNKTILLVGETGTGKSKLINALVNYAMGVKWEDNIWFQIVEDEKRSQSDSQTSDVMVYQIFGFENKTLPYSLTIIDTPGYGDTRGTEQDVIVSERLLDLFRSDEGVNEMNAVGLVLKATENRVSDRLRYIFDSVVSLFGKDMEKKIVTLITHSPGRKPKNVLEALEAADIKCARNDENQPVHFLFDNCQEEDRSKGTKYLQQSDEISMTGLSQFTDFLEKTAPQRLETTVGVLNERIRLAACINNLQERIEFIERKQCTACDKKCEESKHRNTFWIYEPKTRTVQNTNQQMKEKYEKGKAESEKSTDLLETLKKEIEYLQKEKDQWLEEAYQHVLSLEKNALNVNSLSTHVHLDFLIEKMKEKGDTEKIQKLEEMKKRMDEDKGFKAALSYGRSLGSENLPPCRDVSSSTMDVWIQSEGIKGNPPNVGRRQEDAAVPSPMGWCLVTKGKMPNNLQSSKALTFHQPQGLIVHDAANDMGRFACLMTRRREITHPAAKQRAGEERGEERGAAGGQGGMLKPFVRGGRVDLCIRVKDGATATATATTGLFR